MIIRSFPACLHQSPVGDLDDSGVVDVAGQPGGPEGSGTVLTPLQPMSPQRQALLSSRCYQLSEADCWDLPVDYTKIKRLGEEQDHKEVTGRSTSLCKVSINSMGDIGETNKRHLDVKSVQPNKSQRPFRSPS